MTNKLDAYKREAKKYREGIDFFNSSGKSLYDEIIRTAIKSYQLGEIDLVRFTGSFENAVQIMISYLDNVLGYNVNILEQIYLSNQ